MTDLNLSTGGEFSPFLKYNAKAGRWFVRDDNGNDIEIASPRFAIDLENIKTGWIHFPPTSPPSFVWDVEGVRGPRPGDGYKDGFKVFLMSTDAQPALANKPLGVREWTSNAYAAKAGLLNLYQQYQANAGQNPDKVPVVRCVSVKVIKSDFGDSFEPVFAIEAWVERNRVQQLTEAATANVNDVSATPDTQLAPTPSNNQPTGPGDLAATVARKHEVAPATPLPDDVLDDPIPF